MGLGKFGRILASWGSSTTLWNFWTKRIFLARIVPIILFVLLTYNPFSSYAQWAGAELHMAECGIEPFKLSDHLAFSLASIMLLGCWVYLANKCWRGVGESLFKGGILVAIVGVLFYLMLDHGIVSHDRVWLTLSVEIAIGFVLGLAFTFVLIDRQLSGVVTTSTVLERDVHHTDGIPHHGG